MANARKFSKAFVEALESRRLLSASILGPSAVEGNYKGDVTYNGITEELRVKITSDSATLTVVGIGTKKVPLTAREFKELREGTFAYSGTIHGVSLTLDGSVTDGGARIAGAAEGSGDGLSGTASFVLKKY